MPGTAILAGTRGAVGFLCLIAALAASAASTSVVISQVYGGGGNIGAAFQNDFVELHNKGGSAVSLSGWTVQYADSNNWQLAALSGTLQPGQFYLVQLGGGGNGTPLPTPNASTTIPMGTSSGKVALVNSFSLLSGTCPASGTIIDFVGYGSANCAEGSAVSAPGSTTAAIRKSNGCTDTDNNLTDFSVSTPTPRNLTSPAILCLVSPVFTAWGRTTNGHFAVQFTADPARSNVVQFSTNLTSWTILPALVSQVGNVFTCTDTNPVPRRSYRVWSQ